MLTQRDFDGHPIKRWGCYFLVLVSTLPDFSKMRPYDVKQLFEKLVSLNLIQKNNCYVLDPYKILLTIHGRSFSACTSTDNPWLTVEVYQTQFGEHFVRPGYNPDDTIPLIGIKRRYFFK